MNRPDVEKALERHLRVWKVAPEDRAIYGHAFRSGWHARTAGGEVLVTQERLDELEARAGVCWGNR